MNIETRIETLLKLEKVLEPGNPQLESVIEKAEQHNKWFTRENILCSLNNFSEQFLDKAKISEWLSGYDLNPKGDPKIVGIVMAGNIPLVGFHDLLCVFLAGHKALIKLSSKDDVLFPFLLQKLYEADAGLKNILSVTEVIKGMDAVIATGSNNSSRYFQYYFGRYPHIIRSNRSSVAVLTGHESKENLEQLGFDIFSYFGLGCRNVSKLYVPENYSFDLFFQAIEKYSAMLHHHNKYKNNYDYNRVLLLMNNTPFLTNDFLIVKEDAKISSPVSTLHFEYYKRSSDLKEKLSHDSPAIQCVVGEGFIPFGQSQSPALGDYADDTDIMKFLLALN